MDIQSLADLPYTVKVMISFWGAFISDICWAFYFLKIAEHRALAAGFWGGTIIALTALLTKSYVTDTTLVIPTILGAALGTAATVKYQALKKKSENK